MNLDEGTVKGSLPAIELKKEYCDILRKADAIFMEELHNADGYHKTSQAFAVFLPVKSGGEGL